jgi:hypothetical protein
MASAGRLRRVAGSSGHCKPTRPRCGPLAEPRRQRRATAIRGDTEVLVYNEALGVGAC